MNSNEERDNVPLLAKNNNSSGNKASKRRRRKSVFNGPSGSDNNHNISDMRHGRPTSGTDFEKTDSWGILHDTTDDESHSRAASDINNSQFSGSYIDHRPSMGMIEAPPLSSGTDSRRPSTAPKNSRPTPNHNSMQHEVLRRRQSLPRMSPSDAERWARANSYVSYGSTKDQKSGSDVVIDVDALMEHVKRHRSPSPGSSRLDIEEEAYNSKPPSRRSSDSSSLNDVCLPIDEDASGPKVWPDVSVLEEFSKEETERLRSQAIQDTENFHFQYDDEDDYEDEQASEGIAFSRPIVTNIDVPELGNTKINEAEHLEKGRLRPKKITPWHLKRHNINLPGLSSGQQASF